MGVSFERRLRERDTAASRIRSAYAFATITGESHEYIMQCIKKAYDDAAEMSSGKMTTWQRAYLDGYQKPLSDELYRDHLIFCRTDPTGRLWTCQRYIVKLGIPEAGAFEDLYGRDFPEDDTRKTWMKWPSGHFWGELDRHGNSYRNRAGKVFFQGHD